MQIKLEKSWTSNKDTEKSGILDISKVVSIPGCDGSTWFQLFDETKGTGHDFSTEYPCFITNPADNEVFNFSYFESQSDEKAKLGNGIKTDKTWSAYLVNKKFHIINGKHRTVIAWILYHLRLIKKDIPIHNLIVIP
jgi:hypothetical protein